MNDSSSPCTIEEFKAGDGCTWRYRRYPAVGTPRAEVVFIHGIQSHGGWYEHSSASLAQAGFNVYFLDRRGSGLNQSARGDAPSFRRLLDDLAEFLTKPEGEKGRRGEGEKGRRGEREKGRKGMAEPKGATDNSSSAPSPLLPFSPSPLLPPRLPVFLAAISWGGKLAVALERRHPGLVNGLILACPGFFAKVRPTFGQQLLIVLCRLIRPRQLFAVPLNEPELFTANPVRHQYLRDDPLRLKFATARLLLESARLDAYLRFVPKYVHVPVLLLLAENDSIIHNRRTRDYVQKFATPDKQIIEYPGAHHTLEFEPDPERYIADMRDWLERQVQAKNRG